MIYNKKRLSATDKVHVYNIVTHIIRKTVRFGTNTLRRTSATHLGVDVYTWGLGGEKKKKRCVGNQRSPTAAAARRIYILRI